MTGAVRGPVQPAAPAGPPLDPQARRLLWRCRRGMKELDLLLAGYARATLADATAPQREEFAALLELPDPVLADCLLGGGMPPDPRFAPLVGRIRELCRSGPGAGISCR